MCVAPCGPSLCGCVVSGSDEYVDVCSSLSLTWSIIVWVCGCVGVWSLAVMSGCV